MENKKTNKLNFADLNSIVGGSGPYDVGLSNIEDSHHDNTINKDEAESLKAKLEEVGADVELK